MDDSPKPAAAALSEGRVRCAVDVTAATWLLQAEDLGGARRLLESALTASPHDVRARSLLGQVLFRQRDFVSASEVFERLIAEFPSDVPLLFNLALCHLKGGRPAPAAATLRQILQVRPEHPRARAWLRVAEAATPGPPSVELPEPPPPSRTSTRPARLEEVPRVSLPPGALVAKDESGVVSLRVDDETRWVVRRSTLAGYSGDVAQGPAAHGAGFLALSGEGTALLRAPGALMVLELRGEETGARASALAAYATPLSVEVADPEVVGEFGEAIFRLEGTGPVVLEARAELTALPVSLTHATTVRWDHVVGWTGHVIGAPSSQVDADGRTLARFAGSGSLLLAMHDETATAPLASYGRHEVIRRLGGGPLDEILLARSAGPGGYRRKVVLERRLVGGQDGRPIERLAHEAHAYALLTHPAIARLFDFLLIDGHPVLVREYVSGVSLAELVTTASDGDVDARTSIALYVAHGVLSALAAAHDASDPETSDLVPLVHGDIRTGCVLVAWNGDVKVTGFAGARLEAGRPPTMRSDVRAAAWLLLDMLGPRAIDPSSDIDLRLALTQLPLGPIRVERRDTLRDMLLAALIAGAAGAPRARDLAEAIAEATDLSVGRTLSVDVMGALRDRQGASALSSFPPPAVTVDEDDSRIFHHRAIPKPSPVPKIGGEAPVTDPFSLPADLPAPSLGAPRFAPLARAPLTRTRDSHLTPPPVQPPSLEPSAVSAAPPARTKRKHMTTVLVAGVVAVAAGIVSLDSARSGNDSAAPPPPAAARPSAPPVPSGLALVLTPPAPVASSSSSLRAIDVSSLPLATAASSSTGVLRAPARARQHRIFVDGRAVGEGAGDYTIACGTHEVRVGSQGDEKRIDVPCGSVVDLE